MRLPALFLFLSACKASPPVGALEIGNLIVSRSELASRPELDKALLVAREGMPEVEHDSDGLAGPDQDSVLPTRIGRK